MAVGIGTALLCGLWTFHLALFGENAPPPAAATADHAPVDMRGGGSAERAVPPADTEVTRDAVAPNDAGSVTFLDTTTRRPPALEGWRMRRLDSDPWAPIPPHRDGRITLVRAAWSFQPTADYSLLEPRVDLCAEPHQVAWVSVGRSIELRVVSRFDGAPITSASVRHASTPRGAPIQPRRHFEAHRWSASWYANAAGVVRVPGVFLPCVVCVAAAGHDPALVELTDADGPTLVALDPSHELARTLMAVDAESGDALISVSARAWAVDLVAERTTDGVVRLHIPASLCAEDLVSIEAPDYVPALVAVQDLLRATERPPRVVLHRSCTLTIQVTNAASERCVVAVRGEAAPDSIARPFDLTTDVEGGAKTLLVGAAASLEVMARDALGACQVATISTVLGHNRLVLDVNQGSLLELYVTDGDGRGAAMATARVQMADSGGSFIVPAVDGRIRVPFPSRVAHVRVSAPGHATVRLRPEEGSTNREGSVSLQLSPAFLTAVRVRDARNHGVAGISVGVVGRTPESTRRKRTSHPAWTREEQPNVRSITDGSGRATFMLPCGVYEVLASLPAEAIGIAGFSHYPMQSTTVTVLGGAEHDVMIDPPRRMHVVAIDSSTGLPINEVRIRVGDCSDAAPVAATTRSIWIPASCASFTVGAEGFETTDVVVPAAGESAIVALHPGGVGTLILEGQAAELKDANLTLLCRGKDRSRQRVRVTVGRPDAVPVHIIGSGLIVTIESVTWRGKSWRFDALQPEWHPGGTLRFLAVHEHP